MPQQLQFSFVPSVAGYILDYLPAMGGFASQFYNALARDRCFSVASNLPQMKIHAQSPCRVDLAGGTLDIWPLYLFHENAVTVNFAVDRYTSCELVTRNDSKIVLRSADQKGEETFDSLDQLRGTTKYRLPLLAYVVRFFRPTTGIELSTNSEAPTGAG